MKYVCRIQFLDMQSLNCAPQIECMCTFSICSRFSVLLYNSLQLSECLVFVSSGSSQLLTWIASRGRWTCFLDQRIRYLLPSFEQLLFLWPRDGYLIWSLGLVGSETCPSVLLEVNYLNWLQFPEGCSALDQRPRRLLGSHCSSEGWGHSPLSLSQGHSIVPNDEPRRSMAPCFPGSVFVVLLSPVQKP